MGKGKGKIKKKKKDRMDIKGQKVNIGNRFAFCLSPDLLHQHGRSLSN